MVILKKLLIPFVFLLIFCMSDVSLVLPQFQNYLSVLQNLTCQNVQVFFCSNHRVTLQYVSSSEVFLMVNKWKKGLVLAHLKAAWLFGVCLKLPNIKKGCEFVLILNSKE